MSTANRLARHRIVVTSVRICFECGRNFVLTDEGDADEWYNGHDCEVVSQTQALTVDSTYNPAGGEHRHNTNKGAIQQ